MPQNQPNNNPVSNLLDSLGVPENRYSQELLDAEKALGERQEILPGDQDPESTTVEFQPGELTEKDVIEKRAALLRGKIDTYEKYVQSQELDHLLHQIHAVQGMDSARTPEQRQYKGMEFVLAGQGKTFHEYTGELVRQLVDVQKRAEDVQGLSDHLGLRPLENITLDQKNAKQFLKRLKEEMQRATRFAEFVTVEKQIRLQQQIPEIDAQARTPGAAPEWLYLQRWVDAMQLRTAPPDALLERRNQTLAALQEEDRVAAQKILSTNAAAMRDFLAQEHAHTLTIRMQDLLQGKKEAIGIQEDFVPQILYGKIANHIDAETHDTQKWLTEKIAKNPDDAEMGNVRQYMTNTRSALDADTADFAQETGVYQLRLDELARMQNVIGKHLNPVDSYPGNLEFSQSDVRSYENWLETMQTFRQGQIREAMDAADEMLSISLDERVEQEWNTSGRVFVTELADKLADAAAVWMPSEKSEGIAPGAFRTLAPLLGFPKSKEEQKKKLVGSIKEQLGWPQDKDWGDLTPDEKATILENCKSVLKSKQNFNTSTIRNLRRTMDTIDTMPPVSTIPNQEVDQELIAEIEKGLDEENARRKAQGNPEVASIDRNMTGVVINGKTINQATALVLLLRQRRKDWGNVEEGQGFSGEYAKYLRSLEGGIQQHFDVAQSIFEMQHAWEEYSVNMLKVTAIAGISPAVIAFLIGVAPSAFYHGSRFMLRTVPRAARVASKIRGLPESNATLRATKEALTKMRYLRWERQMTQYLEASRAGRFVQNSRAFQRLGSSSRFAGRSLTKLAWVAIPAVAAYDSYTIQQRAAGAKGNAELQSEYRSQYGTVGWETSGYVASMFAGPLAVVVLPTVWAGGEMQRAQSDRRANWKRTAENWTAEMDSAGLLQRLEDIAPGQEVGAAGVKGGGAYGTLVGQLYESALQRKWPADVQVETAEMVGEANRGARGQIYASYFAQNLLIPEGTSEEKKKDVVQKKVEYIGAATHGGMERVSADIRSQADLYVQLRELHDELVRNHQPTAITFINREGKEEAIDLADLFDATRMQTAMSIVRRYAADVLPPQELVMFNTIGSLAVQEKNAAEGREAWKNAQGQARKVILSKLLHHIHDAEQVIRTTDWPGVDVPVIFSGNSRAENLSRSYLAMQLNEKINQGVQQLLQGNWTLEEYEKFLNDCKNICFSVRDKATGGNMFYKEAQQSYTSSDALERASSPRKNPLYALFEEQ